jgi:hypothetical protein
VRRAKPLDHPGPPSGGPVLFITKGVFIMTTTRVSAFTTCESCGTCHEWTWEEAFDKFGFGDGDGLVMTDSVAGVLIAAGYTVESRQWGLHNVVIISITLDGVEQIPEGAPLGYDDPRGYLPAAIVALLDANVAGEF